jgi:hypothetical protein
MTRFVVRWSLWYLVLFLPCAAHAAQVVELSARVNESECGPSCGDAKTLTGEGTAAVSYSYELGGSGSAFATVLTNENGGLALKAYATATGGSGEGQFVNMGAAASAFWQDTVFFTGTLLDISPDFNFDFSGSVSGDAQMNFDGVACVAAGICGAPHSYDQPGKYSIPYTDAFIAPNQPITFSFSLGASATGHGSAFGGPNTSTADVSHTLTLLSITLRDANGNMVPGVTVHSESGFNYNPFVVPEPSALLLFAVGCVALVGRRR